MATIHIKRAHKLSREEVKEKVERLVDDLKTKLGVNCHWEGDSLKLKRPGASGTIDLGDEVIDVKIKLGVMLTPLKSKIEMTIKENIHEYLG
jgi:putative polyhydroxyalkanoate system protein